MDISVVILNYKSKGLLKQCIKGIVVSQPQLEYEIIVVDNNSNDNSLAMVKEMFLNDKPDESQASLPLEKPLQIPSITAIQSLENGGFSKGNNLGIKQAKGKYVLIINPDVAMVPGALEKMYAFLEKNPEVGIIGPKLINPDGSIQRSCRRFPTLLTPIYRRTFLGKLPIATKTKDYYLMQDFDHHNNRVVDWLFGACLLIRNSYLKEVGLFDERFFMYFEDLDLCRRFWERGYKIYYFADVELVHYHAQWSTERSGVMGIFTKGGRVHLQSGLKYFAKYFGAKLPAVSPLNEALQK